MKIRNGFVSNSSTSSFIIRNISNEHLTLKDFIKEISFIYYSFDKDLDEVLDSVSFDYYFLPGESMDVWEFGDHTKNTDPLWAQQLENLSLCQIDRTKSFSWTLTRNQ